MCPFLAADHGSTKQWLIRQLTRAPFTLGALAGAIGRLPAFLQKLIVTSYAGACSASAILQLSIDKICRMRVALNMAVAV
jgi:hypothetical protein